jgi:hypothetical protein
MSSKDDTKITWITCPDCGSKIGIIVSVGKSNVTPQTTTLHEEFVPATNDFTSKLETAGVDLELVDIEEDDLAYLVSPKKFLGDLWGPINDTIKELGGNWIRDGRNSRWEITKD